MFLIQKSFRKKILDTKGFTKDYLQSAVHLVSNIQLKKRKKNAASKE